MREDIKRKLKESRILNWYEFEKMYEAEGDEEEGEDDPFGGDLFGGGEDEGGEGGEGGGDEGGDPFGGGEGEEGEEGEEEEEEEEEPKPYLDNPEYRISLVLDEALKHLKRWFKKGKFKDNGYEIEAISRDRLMSGMQNGFYFQFSREKTSFFSLYFMIDMEWAQEEVIKNAHVQIKRYNYEGGDLKKTYMENINIDDLKEDWLLKKVKEIDVKKRSKSGKKKTEYSYDKEIDLKDNIY